MEGKNGLKKWLKRVGIGLILLLIAAQFVPVQRINPVERGEFTAPADVQAILRRACYDCHSNETNWPWYSKIAPVSFLLANDVKEGRREVNFSTWQKYENQRRLRKLKEIAKEVENGDMPPWYYLPLHPDAKLSSAERQTIISWAKQG
jgi:cytochrome c551/c552